MVLVYYTDNNEVADVCSPLQFCIPSKTQALSLSRVQPFSQGVQNKNWWKTEEPWKISLGRVVWAGPAAVSLFAVLLFLAG